jgi:hypothetical protein
MQVAIADDLILPRIPAAGRQSLVAIPANRVTDGEIELPDTR